jgi:hypothetical protein
MSELVPGTSSREVEVGALKLLIVTVNYITKFKIIVVAK